MTREFDKPYWEICRLSPYNDHFNVMYQDYSEEIKIGEIPFILGHIIFDFDNIKEYDIDRDTINRFLDSLDWCLSYYYDNKEHRNKILEFHIANAALSSDFIRVYYKDNNDEWQYEYWSFSRCEDRLEIISPNMKRPGELQIFNMLDDSMSDILFWLKNDIKSICGDMWCLWIDFGNR